MELLRYHTGIVAEKQLMLLQIDASHHDRLEGRGPKMALTYRPTADVAINLKSDNPGQGKVSPASIVFTSKNWDTVQAVGITGVNDCVNNKGKAGQFPNFCLRAKGLSQPYRNSLLL